MYAVFELSGYQFSAQEGDVVKVPFQNSEPGNKLDIDKVLLIQDKDVSTVGTPTVAEAHIEAEVLGDSKGEKVRVFKFKRRTKYRRTQGHRSKYTEIKIVKIVPPGN